MREARIKARFWAKVALPEAPDECMVWTACRNSDGYGQFKTPEGQVGAHRFAYTLLVGPIGQGDVLDHLCRNPACVRPSHLEPVTVQENTLRGVSRSAANAKKTHCPAGHAYSGANTGRYQNERYCRECNRRRCREYRARLKGESE